MSTKVSVIGLGRIGLPTALILKKVGFDVLGVDTSKTVLENISLKNSLRDEPDVKNLLKEIEINISQYPEVSDIYLIAVPTPLTVNQTADLTYLENAILSIKPLLKKDDLVIIESTCPIGSTEKMHQLIPDVSLAYCSEKVLPGNVVYELLHNDRIIGGVDFFSTEKAYNFYRKFVQGDLWKTDAKTAEAVKLAENAYRDVNIAFANELSMVADYVGISSSEMITLANCHPRVNILEPGPGVGGHCVAVDPYFLMQSAPEHTKLTAAARKVNTAKKEWVIQKIKETHKQYKCQAIACLGLTYKSNVCDFRESAAFYIAESLARDFEVLPIDPYYERSVPLAAGIESADLIVTLVSHDLFKSIPASLLKKKVVLDFAGVLM